MPAPLIYAWKKIPFVRLLLPFMIGILLSWYFPFLANAWLYLLVVSGIACLSFSFLPFFNRFRLSFLSGSSATLLFVSLGGLLIMNKDIRRNKDWFGHGYQQQLLKVTFDEPLVEKTKSFKVNAVVDGMMQDGKQISVKGKIIVYLEKDSSLLSLGYGSQLIFKKPLQEIKNSGNPGGFDYKRYAFFQGITHQVYLKKDEFEILDGRNETWLNRFLYTTRQQLLSVLRQYIKGEKELGLAEALLIGYKDDLDKTLVQSYSNTGVVHIIAISGLHLGLIYWLLVMLLKPLKKNRKLKWLSPVLIITGLWLFSLLAGAQPSILRSALMFSGIVIGDLLSKRSNIYNTLAFSAFLLLCFNPYWLWDVGFQLSYVAVLSIVLFMQPIYHLFYFKNRILDFLWKINAVTLAAQILTVPVSIYHFHQFPVYFMLTNLLAVPLSSIILLGEIFLCLIYFIPVLASLTGKIISWMIRLMNTYIEKIEALPFSLWTGLQIDMIQTILLTAVALAAGYWLIEKNKTALKTSIVCLLAFTAIRSYSFIETGNQQKIIVYNIPQKRAIDFIQARHHLFFGDTSLLTDDFASHFHLQPSRTLYRTTAGFLPINFHARGSYIHYAGKHILILDEKISFSPVAQKQIIDLLILSGNPRIYINRLAAGLDIKQLVIDGSVPAWKASYWKKNCDSLHIPYHDVSNSGAFVMNL